ncbi:hypothetical protein DUI87_10845 [Hirundo rustica rustica]|uniref:Uncharacterized protein n=1 Tax=Hirundo rustica rustica TaxID=333673 RepID=A0A3M0KQZ3_HIRRU|nr:hypothetical protein DUI87_10845 [Hirundo rustica rustica]
MAQLLKRFILPSHPIISLGIKEFFSPQQLSRPKSKTGSESLVLIWECGKILKSIIKGFSSVFDRDLSISKTLHMVKVADICSGGGAKPWKASVTQANPTPHYFEVGRRKFHPFMYAMGKVSIATTMGLMAIQGFGVSVHPSIRVGSAGPDTTTGKGNTGERMLDEQERIPAHLIASKRQTKKEHTVALI